MIGQTLKKRYKVISLLGQGGMGDVYLADDQQTGKQVAVKFLARQLNTQPESLERFRREAETLRQLNHPNIVKFVGAFDHEGQYVIVMEYVPGGSLHDLLKQGPLPVDQARRIAIELCDALIRSHHLNIVHRDLKPENVLLDQDGKPKLADFGVARLGEGTRMTRTGTQVGTPYYMAPEAWGGKPLDAQADIWSLGIMLFEMLAGQVPFSGDTPLAVMGQVNTATIPNLKKLRPETTGGLIKIIKRMLARNKKRRYPTMREVAVDLERERYTATPKPPIVNRYKPAFDKTIQRIKTIRLSPAQSRNSRILAFAFVLLFGFSYLARQTSFSVSSLLPDPEIVLPIQTTSTLMETSTTTATITPTSTATRIPTQTASITPTPVFVEGNTLFEDDFESGSLSSYTVQTVPGTSNPSSYWIVVEDSNSNHALHAKPTSSIELFLRFGSGAWKNHSINFDVKFINQYLNKGHFEFSFRTNGSTGEAYIIVLDKAGLGLVSQYVENSKFKILDLGGTSKELKVNEEEWYSIRVDVFETTISIFVNGELYKSHQSETGSKNGYISFGAISSRGEMVIDNIRVVELISR